MPSPVPTLALLLGIAVSMAEAQAPGPLQRPHLPLEVLAETLAVCRLQADALVPPWASGPSRFLTISRTSEELSITSVQASLPPEARCARNYRTFRWMIYLR